MNRMLINAHHEDDVRVALVDGQNLNDLDHEHPGREQQKGNIFSGIVSDEAKSLNAYFVKYDHNRRAGFLPIKEVAPEYFTAENSTGGPLKIGQKVMVQIDKEERGSKGAALTTFISLAGSCLVLMTNNPSAGGISRRIEGDERSELREAINSLELPPEMGLIIRTAGVGRSLEELQWDLSLLLKQHEAIQAAYHERSGPFLIHQESDVVIRAIRDYLREKINEIVIDNWDVFVKVQDYIKRIRPDFLSRVKYYKDNVPLFTRFQIESQVELAFQREVRLSSGGMLVIDQTEAMVTIDINSGRATKGSNIEETALNTNLEAAREIARQLRLRDLGGLIVIDFIDMTPRHNHREVENCLREALKMDRARVQIGRISPQFGLLEMSRQRLRPSLGEFTHINCPRCHGQGRIRSVESLVFSLLRLIEEDAMKEKTAQIRVQVPIAVATYLLNEKRQTITEIGQRHHVSILILPNNKLETPNYNLERIKQEDLINLPEGQNSYQLITSEEDPIPLPSAPVLPTTYEPAVKNIEFNQEKFVAKVKKKGILQRLWQNLFASDKAKAVISKPIKPRGNYQNKRLGNKQFEMRHQHKYHHRKPQHHQPKKYELEATQIHIDTNVTETNLPITPDNQIPASLSSSDSQNRHHRRPGSGRSNNHRRRYYRRNTSKNPNSETENTELPINNLPNGSIPSNANKPIIDDEKTP